MVFLKKLRKNCTNISWDLLKLNKPHLLFWIVQQFETHWMIENWYHILERERIYLNQLSTFSLEPRSSFLKLMPTTLGNSVNMAAIRLSPVSQTLHWNTHHQKNHCHHHCCNANRACLCDCLVWPSNCWPQG